MSIKRWIKMIQNIFLTFPCILMTKKTFADNFKYPWLFVFELQPTKKINFV